MIPYKEIESGKVTKHFRGLEIQCSTDVTVTCERGPRRTKKSQPCAIIALKGLMCVVCAPQQCLEVPLQRDLPGS
jgi:hypothetical protein